MSKKKPIAVIITDDHLSDKSIEVVKSIHKKAREKAISLGLEVVYHGGDIIDSRKAQTWGVLKTLDEIIEEYKQDGLCLRIIPGNHSKPDYHSEESFLDIFKRRKGFDLVRSHKSFQEGNVVIHMIPFFSENGTYSQYLKKAITEVRKTPEYDHILITHIAVDKVTNNDGSEVENELTSKVFKVFKKVLIGHYHNMQVIDSFIHYIGSSRQLNFGEDESKGMTILYEDLSMDQIYLDTPIYRTTSIDLSTIKEVELNQIIKQVGQSKDFEKIKIVGSNERIESFKSTLIDLETKGIKIDKKVEDPEIDMSYTELINFKGFDSKEILKEWTLFEEKKEIDEELSDEIRERLEKVLNKK